MFVHSGGVDVYFHITCNVLERIELTEDATGNHGGERSYTLIITKTNLSQSVIVKTDDILSQIHCIKI